MIRPFSLITALLFCLSGAYLFAVKHRAQMLDDRLAAVTLATRLDAGRIQVLQAQWALEVDPARLQQLAGRFTSLQPMQPSQLVTLSALGNALPAPGSAAPGTNPAAPVLPVLAQTAAAAPALPFTPALPLPPAEPMKLAAAVMPARVASLPAPALATPPLHHARRAGHQPASALAQSRPDDGASVLAAATPPGLTPPGLTPPGLTPPGLTPPGLTMGAPVIAVRALAADAGAPAPPPLPADGGSMLGMAQTLGPMGTNNWP